MLNFPASSLREALEVVHPADTTEAAAIDSCEPRALFVPGLCTLAVSTPANEEVLRLRAAFDCGFGAGVSTLGGLRLSALIQDGMPAAPAEATDEEDLPATALLEADTGPALATGIVTAAACAAASAGATPAATRAACTSPLFRPTCTCDPIALGTPSGLCMLYLLTQLARKEEVRILKC
jgi:hypothetical protein